MLTNARPTPLYLAAIGLSSFTLFSLELLAGRLALPVFGGTPSVWTTALCFFTAAVSVGYLYAHAVATRLSRRTGGLAHAVVAVAVAVAVTFAPTSIAELRVEGWPPVLNVLAVLALVAGAPALLLATTTPLLSAWYSASGRDPWWLYAVSNGASLMGLLAYPLVIEPLVPLSVQRQGLLVLVAVVAMLLIWVALGRGLGENAARMVAQGGSSAVAGTAPSLRRQLVWLFSAIVPAGLLSATSTHLATDYVSSPLLWIGPLGVYLGSFIVAFSERGRRMLPAFERLVPAAMVLMWLPFVLQISWPVPALVSLMLAAFAVLAVAIHGRLALDRPDEAYLTRFYVIQSAGGMLATAFVALVAPSVFSDVYEYPLLLLAAIAALITLPGAAGSTPAARRTTTRRLAPFGVGLAVAAAGLLLAFAPAHLAQVRTFFGITEVRPTLNGTAIEEIHGTTLHGLQFTDGRQTEPTAYFVRSGPLGDVMRSAAQQHPSGADIGVVGLGVGTVASYMRDTDRLTYFEVDQSVVDLAQDRRYFTYLEHSAASPRIVLGDGRLSLSEQPPRAYDLLVLDAFSSDSVPTHLLTVEALRTYLRAMRPGGLIAFQLTNRHFDLVPAVSSTARSLGLETRTRSFTPTRAEKERLAAQPSRWLVVGSTERMAAFDAVGWDRPSDGPVLTDDYSDIMRVMRWR